MVAIKITVTDKDGADRGERLGSQAGYIGLLADYEVEYLVSVESTDRIRDFDALEPEGVYTLGDDRRNVRPRVEGLSMSMSMAVLPQIDDRTEEILQSLRNRKIGAVVVDTCASAEACKLILDANPISIKVAQADYDVIANRLTDESKNLNSFQRDAHVSFSVTTDESEVPKGLLHFLSNFDLATHSWTGETEDEIHEFVATAITGPICKFFTPGLRISRNKALKTSSGRADYSISSDYVQLFRGEDKMGSRLLKEDPKKELLKKSPKGEQWLTLYGPDVPYIFGYYSVGGTDNLLLQFVCIKQDSSAVVHLTDAAFDLTKFSGVFGCRCFMLALLPHLLSLKEQIGTPVGLEWKTVRTEGRGVWQSWTLQIILDHNQGDCALAKDFYYDESRETEANQLVAQWQTMFARLPDSEYLMKLRGIHSKKPCPEDGTARVRCVFVPLCQPLSVTGSFDDELSARLAILHVLKAVTALHQEHLVHNDLRWANVVRKQGANEFVLVDYDDMALMDADGRVPAISWMDADSHAPDIGQIHDQKVDLWGLCKMMTELHCTQGDVSDLVNAGRAGLEAYPELPDSFTRTCAAFCAQQF